QANNLFFNEILTGVESVVGKNGYMMNFSNTDNDPKKESDAILAFIEQRVSGVILQPTFSYEDPKYQEQLRKLLIRLQAPVVVVDRPLSRSVWDGVFFDGYLASYQATE
ncbi:LacI family transcriptional regulator, partial [Romboutsia ilealis]|nr:LacI family transcriptional regulator [Romboutsia ilealis]